MLDFIFKLRGTFTDWLPQTRWTFVQISEKSGENIDHIVDVLSDVLGVEYDLGASVTREDVEKALEILKERVRPELEAMEKDQKVRRDKAVRTYDITMEKIRVLQHTKNWPSAYRTLSNFVGTHEADLSVEMLLSLFGECLRLGIKSNENIQELGRWLRKAIDLCVTPPTKDGLMDALDFIDAYGEHFYTDSNGRRLISSILKNLREPVGEFGLGTLYTTVTKTLGTENTTR